jgi:hypothetical protein
MWDKGGTGRAGDYICFCGKGNKSHQLRMDLGGGGKVHHRTVSTVKRVQFVSNRMSCIVLRVSWCDIIVLSVHAPIEEKSDNSNEFFFL